MNWKRTTLGMGVAAVAGLAAIVTALGAGNNRQIDGQAVLDDGSCTQIQAMLALQLTGDLEGCIYQDWEVVQETPSGIYMERGTETFVGCLDGSTCGTFTTQYKFTAKFAPDGSEIHGRCQHPITGGTGGFAGATGRLDFKDDVETGIFYYRGHIKLPNAAAAYDEPSAQAESGDLKTGC